LPGPRRPPRRHNRPRRPAHHPPPPKPPSTSPAPSSPSAPTIRIPRNPNHRCPPRPQRVPRPQHQPRHPPIQRRRHHSNHPPDANNPARPTVTPTPTTTAPSTASTWTANPGTADPANHQAPNVAPGFSPALFSLRAHKSFISNAYKKRGHRSNISSTAWNSERLAQNDREPWKRREKAAVLRKKELRFIVERKSQGNAVTRGLRTPRNEVSTLGVVITAAANRSGSHCANQANSGSRASTHYSLLTTHCFTLKSKLAIDREMTFS
jgi:hypothetical protein